MSKLLRKAEEDARREYPKVGEPVVAMCLNFEKEEVSRYLPHIILGTGAGIYLNYWVETYERAWEISMQKVAELRRMWA